MNHVTLRAMEPEDLDLLYRIENDPELWGVSATNVPYSRYTLHDYIAQSAGNIYVDGQVRLIIETPDHEVVGIADVVCFDAKNCRAEVGLVIERRHRGQGYGSQALTQLLHYSLRVLHLHQLYAFVPVDNKSSIALFTKEGFSQENKIKDWLFDGKHYVDALLMQKIF